MTTSVLPAHPRDTEPLSSLRNPDGSYSDNLTQFMGAHGVTVRQWREAHQCYRCGHCCWDPDTNRVDLIEKVCEHGCCVVISCVQCGYYDSGYGEAGCECDDGI